MLLTCQEATKEVQLNQALRQNDEKYRTLIDNSLYCFLLSKPDGTILEANKATEKVFGYTLEEIRKLGRAGILDETDPELISQIQKREVEWRANGELIGIRKNGERFPCEFSSVVFIDKSGEKRASTVLIDISERKRIEKEKVLLMNNTEESFVLVDKKLNIINFNKQFKESYKRLLGKEVIEGESIINYAQSGREEAVRAIYKKVLEGETIEFEIQLLEENKVLTYSNTYKPAYDDSHQLFGVFVTSRDITKAKEAQVALVQSEDKYRSIIVHSLMPVLLLDADHEGEVIDYNQAALNMLGYSEKEFSTLRIQELFNELSLSLLKSNNKGELTGIRKNGETFFCHFSSANFKDKDGQNRITLTLLDITERKAAELKLNNANRIYSFISAINQSIVHATNKETLFKEVCKIACEVGQFKMAWVGTADDQGKTVKPLEYYGDFEGYLSKNEILIQRKDSLALDPTGQAARDNVTNVCTDIANDPRMELWKYKALKRGFRSSIAIPIKKANTLNKGVFTLYASETNFFNYEEVKLLENVAYDIAFALDAFEAEELHRIAEEQIVYNQRRYRAIVENAKDAIIILSGEDTPFYISPSIKRVLGHTSEEANKLDFYSLIHPDDVKEITKFWTKILTTDGEALQGSTFRMLHKDGTWHWLESTFTNLLNDPAISGIVVNFNDVTEKILSAKEREFQRKDKEALINGTDDLIWSVRRDFTLIAANKSFTESLFKAIGIRVAIGDNLLLKEKFDKDFIHLWQSLYENAFEGTLKRTELYSPAKGLQPEQWLDISFYPIYEGEKVVGLACHSRDITKRLKREQEKELIFEIINALQTKESVEKSLKEVLRMLSQYLGFSAGESWFYNKQFEKLNLRAYWIKDEIFSNYPNTGIEIYYQNESLPDIALRKRETVFWKDIINSPLFSRVGLHKDLPFATAIGLPIIIDNEVIAIFTFYGEMPIHNQDELISLSKWVSVQIASNIHSKQADEELLLSNNRFRTIFQEAPMGITLFDPQTGKYDVNPMFEEIVGRKAIELTTESWKEYTHPEDLNKDLALMAKLQDGEINSYNLEKRYFKPDNSLVWVNMTMTTVKAEIGNLYLCMIEDISAQKMNEEEILANRELLRLAESISHIGSWDLNFETEESNWSDEFYRICGYEPKGFIPSLEIVKDIVHPDDIKYVMETFNKTVLDAGLYSLEHRILRPSGEIRKVISTGSIQNNAFGKAFKLIGTIQDITEKKNAELALAISEESYRCLFERNPEAVFSFNFKGKFISANQSMIKMVGGTFADLYQSTFETFIAPEDRSRVLALFQKAIRGETQNYDCDIITNRGQRLTLNVTKVPIIVGGKIIGVYGIAKDITKQKFAEEALTESEEKYKELFNNNPLPMCAFGINDSKILMVNDAAIITYGYTREEFSKMTIDDLLDYEKYHFSSNEAADLFSNEPNVQEKKTWRHRTKSGQRMEVEIVYRPITFEDSKASLAVIYDVTEKKQQEAHLKLLESVIIHANDSVMITEPSKEDINEHYIIYINEAFTRMTGYSADEIMGHSPKILEGEKTEGAQLELARLAVRKRIPVEIELIHYSRRGQEYWVSINIVPIFSEKGEVTHFVSVQRDITEKKTNELFLKNAKERYDLINRATSEIIWDWDLQTNLVFRNENFKLKFGYELEEYIDNSDFEKLIHFEDRERVIKKMASNLTDPQVRYWEDEYRFIKANGEVAYVYDRGYIIYNEDNNPVRMLGAMEDITNRKQLELEKDRMSSDLIQRNNDLEQFAYIISHNLRAPLANIIGFVELLQTYTTKEEQDLFMQQLSVSAEKLDIVIQDLNSILQVRRENNEVRKSVNIKNLVDDISKSISNIIDKEGVKIECDCSETPEILTIKSYLQSIFFNLITNSIKYKKADIAPIINIKTKNLGDSIEISFTDNGIGLNLQKVGKNIFGLYKRFHQHVEGKGMGLFMTKNQVEALGGTISIQSKENIGTTFIIKIPNT